MSSTITQSALEHPTERANPLLVMISQQGGTNLFNYKIDESIQLDPQLISCGLNAFSQFINEAFVIKENINKIQFNRYTLFVLHCEQLIIYYLFTGNEVTSIETVTKFMHELINTRVWYELNQKPYQVTTRQKAELRILVRHHFLDSPYK
ncbi:MAG: hypothetical protein ACW98K_05805 [Candidatus Kariarchaeaceae archaeon]